MQIPFLSLKDINSPYEQLLQEAVGNVLEKGTYILGDKVSQFEINFATFCQAEEVVGVGNGFDALLLAFKVLDLPKDSEVIVPANTYVASVLPLIHLGLNPIFVEPNAVTLLLDEDKVVDKITVKTRAILAVDLYGRCCNYTALRQIADQYEIYLVTDAAQALGAQHAGKQVTAWSDLVAYSFYPTKILGALGDGGAVVTSNLEWTNKLRALRNYGMSAKNITSYYGVNSRLDELQAAFLLVKLKYVDVVLTARRQLARFYLDTIQNSALELPISNTWKVDAWCLFTVRVQNRDQFVKYLATHGIEVAIHYPIPIHLQPAFRGNNIGQYPITEQICREIISLPFHQCISVAEKEYLVKVVNDFS